MDCVLCSRQMTEYQAFNEPYSTYCFGCNMFACNEDLGVIRNFLVLKNDGDDTYGIHAENWVDGFEYFVFWKEEGVFSIHNVSKMKVPHFTTYSRPLIPEDAMETLERLMKLKSFE